MQKNIGKISYKLNFHYNYHVFPFVPQTFDKNDHLASLDHALDSNQGTQILSTYREAIYILGLKIKGTVK